MLGEVEKLMGYSADRSLLDDAPWALERFIGSGGIDPQIAGLALEKFFSLTALTSCPLAMISRNVDLLWHTLIEHTELYASLCFGRYGRFIHHRPRSSVLPLPAAAVTNFYTFYRSSFGPVGSEWEDDAHPELVRFGLGITKEEPANARWSGWPGSSSFIIRSGV